METPQFETEEEGNSAEAFFARVSEESKIEAEKLAEMDGNKEVPKSEYKKIERQAKRTAFLKAMKEPATMYAEAVENGDTESAELMKKYLNLASNSK